MATQDMVVRIIGDSRSVERAFARSSNAATQFNRNVQTTGARLDTTSKKFSSFARGAAAGFGGAFALNVAVDGIRSIATAAAESEQVLGQTQVALEATGKSWARYGDTIEETIQKQSRLGFDDEALLRTFSLFVRTTDDVGRALRLNNLAMDVARARFIDLEQAAQLVNKAALGQSGALRRLGINARKGATDLELLALLTEKYGGAAAAASDDSATAFARSQVAIENLKESLGTLLLPALERGAEAMSELAEFTTNLSDALRELGNVRIPEIEIPFNITIGGQSLGDLAGGLAGKLKFTPLNPLFGVTLANAIADQFREQTKAATPDLAASLQSAQEDMISDALAASRFGITPLPSSGENTARSLGSGIRAAIEAAQAEAARVIKVGRGRIAVEKAKDAAAKAAERAEDARVKRAAQRAAALAREQARQFRALGLGADGLREPPTIANLKKQLAQLTTRDDLSKQQRGLLARIRKVLVDPVKKATPETRDAINNLFRTIRDTFNQNDLSKGPLTRTTSLRANQILAGLGLTPDVERELRSRLSSFNSAGVALSGTRRPSGNFRGGVPVTVVNENTINLDGDTVARKVTVSQQKTRRRNPVQKRGSRRGGV